MRLPQNWLSNCKGLFLLSEVWRELTEVECQAVWGGGHRTPKILPCVTHPQEYKYRLWQQSFMQAQTWRVAQRNPSQRSGHFCFHGGEQIPKDRQCYRGCPSLVFVLSSWYNECWILGAVSRQLIYLRITMIVSKTSCFQAYLSSLPAQIMSSLWSG